MNSKNSKSKKAFDQTTYQLVDLFEKAKKNGCKFRNSDLRKLGPMLYEKNYSANNTFATLVFYYGPKVSWKFSEDKKVILAEYDLNHDLRQTMINENPLLRLIPKESGLIGASVSLPSIPKQSR